MNYILFGTSPFSNTLGNWEPNKTIVTVGVNNFCKLPIHFRVANDAGSMWKIGKHKLDGKGIYHKNNYESFRQQFPQFNLAVVKLYEWSADFTFKRNALYCRHSSAMAGINWIIQDSYFNPNATGLNLIKPNIYLVGIDLTWGNRGEWRMTEMGAAIGRATHYANIYRTNPQEELPLSFLPYKSLEELK